MYFVSLLRELAEIYTNEDERYDIDENLFVRFV